MLLQQLNHTRSHSTCCPRECPWRPVTLVNVIPEGAAVIGLQSCLLESTWIQCYEISRSWSDGHQPLLCPKWNTLAETTSCAVISGFSPLLKSNKMWFSTCNMDVRVVFRFQPLFRSITRQKITFRIASLSSLSWEYLCICISFLQVKIHNAVNKDTMENNSVAQR